MSPQVMLWLDDNREPPNSLWTWCKTVDAAKVLLEGGHVFLASLDHDLGACRSCMFLACGAEAENVAPADLEDLWIEKSQGANAPHCSHVGTGFDLVRWMASTGKWPTSRPLVHSANAIGAMKMEGLIERRFGPQVKAEAEEAALYD